MRFCKGTAVACWIVLACCATAPAQRTLAMHSNGTVESQCKSAWADTIPLFDARDIGTLSHPVSTGDPKAQRYFNQGLTFYYGFDTVSAMRSFHMATVREPSLAMGYWGVALAAGGDLNIPINDPCMVLAVAQTKLAVQHMSQASPAERMYIEAIVKRYGLDDSAAPLDRDPAQLSVPYMLAMRAAYNKLFVGAKDPDPDVAALYVVSLMNLRPWLWWTTSGQKSNEIAIAIHVLQNALSDPRFKRHLGLNHFYIHAMEEGPRDAAILALPSANVLMEDAPERTPHLRHMPAHVFLREGNWVGVVAANERAVAADRWWEERCKNLSDPACNSLLVGHYMSHDLLFLSVGYANQGRWNEARARAEQAEDNARRFIAAEPGLEHYLTTRAMIALRFGQWDYLGAIPPPQSPMPNPHAKEFCSELKFRVASAVWYAGQTMVDAQRGRSTNGNLFAYNMAANCAASVNAGWGNNSAAAILAVVHWRVLSRIALRQGRTEQAVEFARLAVEMEDLLNYDEPPGWYVYSRVSLGAALMLHQQPQQALDVFDENLRLHPNDSFSLFGAWQALKALGRSGDAERAHQEFLRQWKNPGLMPSLENM
jgi:tetratricopeptide (TPR) repeat protein